MRALLDGARHMSGFIRDIPQFPGDPDLKQVVGGRNNDYNRRDYNRRDYYRRDNDYNRRDNDYNRRDIRDNYFLKRDPIKDLSKMGYYITIDLELKKGSPLSQEEIKESKCSQKWNTVRKAFANFTGRTYTIPPVYDYSNKKTSKNRSNIKPNNITRNNSRPNVRAQTTNNVVNPNKKLGGTRKNEEMKKIYLGKHSKTIKKMTN